MSNRLTNHVKKEAEQSAFHESLNNDFELAILCIILKILIAHLRLKTRINMKK